MRRGHAVAAAGHVQGQHGHAEAGAPGLIVAGQRQEFLALQPQLRPVWLKKRSVDSS